MSRFLLFARRPALAFGAVVAVATTGALASLGAGNDRSAAEAAIAGLTAVPAHAKLAHEPLEQAELALRRASDARVAGDHDHGSRLEGVAREWAETGRDLVRAAEAERQALALYTKTSGLETKVVRGRALLEETMARRERAREKLQQLEGKPPESKAPATKPPESDAPAAKPPTPSAKPPAPAANPPAPAANPPETKPPPGKPPEKGAP